MGKNVSYEEILRLAIYGDEKDARYGTLAVVRWNDYPPALERREFYRQDGEVKSGKAKGFKLEDLELIQALWVSVKAALAGEAVAPVQVKVFRTGKSGE